MAGAASPAPDDATSAAYHALHDTAVVVDRSQRLRMRFSGAMAAETLNGLVTNDVSALTPGGGQYAVALTAKGKIIADVRIFARADDFLVDTSPEAAPGWSAMIRKYVNPRLARYEDMTASLGDVGVFGPAALRMLRSSAGPAAVIPEGLPEFHHTTVEIDGMPAIVARAPDFGVEGYDVLAAPTVLASLQAGLEAHGAVSNLGDALLVARIEAGRPAWGADMDESTLAQEADMDRLAAISFTKGCYTGQETVARIHFRGHVNRLLRGLRLTGDSPATPGSEVVNADEKPVGTVRSTAHSPGLGAIALALVRREVEPGSTVFVAGRAAEVVELPFGRRMR
jgi:folate-binding protein YgfZ